MNEGLLVGETICDYAVGELIIMVPCQMQASNNNNPSPFLVTGTTQISSRGRMTRPTTHRMGLAIVSGSKPITGPGWIDFDGGLEVVVDRSRSKLLVCLLALRSIHAQRTRHPLTNTRDKGGRHVKARETWISRSL